MDTLTTYVQHILDMYPDLRVATARLHTADGQFNNIVFINDDLVFRFPRSAHVTATYTTQAALLNYLADKLPLPIPVPLYRTSPNVAWEQRFVGYQRIGGEPLYAETLVAIQNPTDVRAIAQQLATFLRALHQLPVTDLPVALPVLDGRAEWKAFYQGIQAQLFPYMRPDAQEWTITHFESYLSQPDQKSYQAVLRHGDFGGSNILYDPQTDRVSGIIDFEGSGLGDPAADVASLSCYGNAFFALWLKHYPEMQTMLDRAAFYRGTFALQEAYYGLRDGNRDAFENGIAEYV